MKSPIGTLYQPQGEPLALNGAADLDESGIRLTKLRLAMGSAALIGSASLHYLRMPGAKTASGVAPVDFMNSAIDLQIKTERATAIGTLLALFDPTVLRNELDGTVDGALNLQGSLAQLRPSGAIKAEKLSFAKADIENLNGSLTLQRSGPDGHENGKLKIAGFRYKKLPVRDFAADIALSTLENDLVVSLTGGKAKLADGVITLNGSYKLGEHKLSVEVALDKVKAAVLADELFEHPGEISGLTDGNIQLSTVCDSYKDAVSNLTGNGQLTLYNGSVTRFGQLQNKLTQANLLHQGLFGFNLNNLLQSVYPVRKGTFKELSGKFDVDSGLLSVKELRYDGDDMRLWGNGKLNLSLETIAVEIAGKIPRVTSSVLRGPVGEVSRAMTFQKVMDVVTRHRLEGLAIAAGAGRYCLK